LSRRSRAINASVASAEARSVLVRHQPIGDGDLLGALGLARQLGRAVHRIDRGDDVAQAGMVPEHRVGLHGREDGEWVGQAGAFDDQPPEAAALARARAWNAGP